jgi:hypothetical protein
MKKYRLKYGNGKTIYPRNQILRWISFFPSFYKETCTLHTTRAHKYQISAIALISEAFFTYRI